MIVWGVESADYEDTEGSQYYATRKEAETGYQSYKRAGDQATMYKYTITGRMNIAMIVACLNRKGYCDSMEVVKSCEHRDMD